MKGNRYFTTIALFLVVATSAESSERFVTIIGRSNVTTVAREITLGEVAAITPSSPQATARAAQYGQIAISQAPAPGETLELRGEDIIERMQRGGVHSADVTYSFPQKVIVRRVGQAVPRQQIEEALKTAIERSGRDASLRSFDLAKDLTMIPGSVDVRAESLEWGGNGQVKFLVRGRHSNGEEGTVIVRAQVDEWRQVPVAKRPIARGSMVSGDDMMMARMNLSAVPPDAVYEGYKVLGFEAQRDIMYGEVFRAQKLSLPPAVRSGGPVTLVYRRGMLEVSATATALESSAIGQKVRVRNENSKKIIVGTVLDSGLVGVTP